MISMRRCEFHNGAPSHSVDNCKSFRFKVQGLLDSKAIIFAPASPSVNHNPMLPHVGHPINMIEDHVEHNLISNVDMLNTPLLAVKEQLLLKNVFPGYTSDCA